MQASVIYGRRWTLGALYLAVGLMPGGVCYAWQDRYTELPLPAKSPVYVSDTAPPAKKAGQQSTQQPKGAQQPPAAATAPAHELGVPQVATPVVGPAPSAQQSGAAPRPAVVIPNTSGAQEPPRQTLAAPDANTAPTRATRSSRVRQAETPAPAASPETPSVVQATPEKNNSPAAAEPVAGPPQAMAIAPPATATAPPVGNSQSLLGGEIEIPSPTQEPEKPSTAAQPNPPAAAPPDAAIVSPTSKTAAPPAEGRLNLLGLLPKTDVEAASFNGAQPGRSTRADVEKHWGQPIDVVKQDDAELWIYKIEPFRRIEMQFVAGIVDSIVVFLERPVAAEKLAKQLSLHKIQAVEVDDLQGSALGQTFPERGVLFSYELSAGNRMVGQILLEPVHAQPFVLRAREAATHELEQQLADLNSAVLFAKRDGEAYWLRARLLLKIGAIEDAQSSVRRAIEIEPDRAEFRLTLAECLAASGYHADAEEVIATILANEDIPDVVRARALCQQGDLLAWGPDHQYQQAIKSHMAAIEAAVPLATSREVRVRREAKRVLIDAHLAVAADVGRGNWKRKNEVVPKWIERAVEFANEMMQNDGGDAELMLRVAEQALVAASGFQSDIDTALMLKDAQRAADKALEGTNDTLWAQHIDWKLGLAFRHALEIEHTRSQPEEALLYAQTARRYLERADTYRHRSFAARRALGWLYFRTGAVHALHEQDHQTAAAMYELALTQFSPTISPTQVESSLFGEALVSMGVTLWEVGLREQAVATTRKGATIVEQAVTRQVAPKSSLAIPYGNLATMHKALGQGEQARDLLELARQHQGVQRR